MGNIEPQITWEVALPSRQTSRVISRLRDQGVVRAAVIDADLQAALDKVDAQTTAIGSSMAAVVRVAQAQRQLEQLAPEASGRLALLADSHALGLADVVTDLQHRLRRR
ncbi:hypothetical protein [Kineococcus glutinatus]|uniref:Uncharacterized protein n=1 Tax=Kineococcus glutinatus TaxID=1070872 RepID=A0ABP9HF32_9ACTN